MKLMKYGLVMSVYTKLGGKNGNHLWIASVDNIAAVSYAVVQLYPHLQDREFRAIPAPPRIQVNLIAHLPPIHLLALLHSNPAVDAESGNLEISEANDRLFLELNKDDVLTRISAVLTVFNSREKTAEDEN